MKFTRLKLVGFKSFCDATELQFEAGLTGVVGPNGCGKSNLVEALRWVMGENSYKAMRASGMDDVIFSGSGNRPGRNSAEVTLVLDNRDRTAPAALNSADILEVTRRIERESGSLYKVNGREVRARDVQLLFADASTGAHSPALVHQGQIGELIAAKPVKRRALLEEAAGISGLYSRRHEAELRLRAAEQNLVRVDDIVAQVQTQLDSLKRQARLAIRYRRLSADIRRAEATLYHLRWLEAETAENQAKAEQTRLIAQLADAAHGERSASAAWEAAQAHMQPLRDAEAAAGAALQRVRIGREQLEDEARRADQRHKELHDRQQQIAQDMAREQALRAECDEALSLYGKERAGLDSEQAAGEAEKETARLAVETLRSALLEVETKARDATYALAQSREQHNQLQQACARAKARLERLHAQSAELRAQNAAMDQKLAQDETHGRAEALATARQRAGAAERDAEDAEKTASQRLAALENRRPELQEAQSRVSRLESEAETLRRILDADGADWPAIVDRIEVDPGYETALGAALGEQLAASYDPAAPLRWAGAGDGAGDAALPEGVTSLCPHVRGTNLLARRLRQIGLVEPADGLRLMPLLRPGQCLVSLAGDLWRWDGLVAAADAPTAAARRLAQRNRLFDLEGEIDAARAARDGIGAQIDELAEAHEQARSHEQAARNASRQAQQAIATAQAALDVAQKAQTQLLSRKEALERAFERLRDELDEAERLQAEARAEFEALEDAKTLAAEADRRQAEVKARREKLEQGQMHLARFENEARLRRARIERIAEELASWRKRRDSAEAQLARLERRRLEVETQLTALAAAPQTFAARRRALDDEIERANREHKFAGDRLADALNLYRDADRAARAASETLFKAREALARVEERLKAYAGQKLQIERSCVENLNIAIARAAQLAELDAGAPLPDQKDSERQIENLKQERERLGGVNLGAEREVEEISEKLSTMVADREDLIAAISKLRTGIANLNREGRARLTEAFDKVNLYFKELFVTLFGGGTAELAFVESDDPLEAGLEIIARPPGKRPQTMTLLSGGEQALTALSLIFAVFLTNPAPICVLDEVDAPLDDANVERFCALLDSMCARTSTRFLVITHNPITMSRMDRLFGVTMAERGVSQLVSVDLTTAKKVAQAV